MGTRIRAWEPAPVVSRFVRRVRTASGAVAVRMVTRRGRVVEQVEHVGSARTDAELALLLSAARERLSPGQDALDLGEAACGCATPGRCRGLDEQGRFARWADRAGGRAGLRGPQ